MAKVRARAFFSFFLLALGLLAGCATVPYRAHPQFDERIQPIRTVAVFPPDVKVYRLTAGGVKELMDEWSETARKNLLASVSKQMGAASRFELKEVDPTRLLDFGKEYEEVRPLFEAVVASVLAHTYNPETLFQTKKDRFEYSLGSLPTLAEATEGEALLFVYAIDHISSGGRIALNVAMVLLGAAAGVVIIPAGGQTAIVTGLVDPKTGDLLWFNVKGSAGGHDLREAAGSDDLVGKLFDEFQQIAVHGKAPSETR